jgi:hypothetical protein
VSRLPAPRSDEDSYDVIEPPSTALAERRSLWIGDDTVLIHLLARLIDQALRALPDAVNTRTRQRHQLARHRRAHRQQRGSPTASRPEGTPAGHDHMGPTPVGSSEIEISDTSIPARAARDNARSW